MSDDRLRDEHESLQRAVQQSRKSFRASPLSAFAQQGYDVIDQYLQARKEGVSREDAVKGIEAVLRAIWPKGKSRFPDPCDGCDGTGWHLRTCWADQRCLRALCARQHPAWEHTYAVPCDCPLGDRFRPRMVSPEDEIANVGKQKRKPKPRGFSPVGLR